MIACARCSQLSLVYLRIYALSINAKPPARSTLLDNTKLIRSLQVSGCVVTSVWYSVHYARCIVFQVDSDHSLSDRKYGRDDEM
jgi:hypothetical protein